MSERNVVDLLFDDDVEFSEGIPLRPMGPAVCIAVLTDAVFNIENVALSIGSDQRQPVEHVNEMWRNRVALLTLTLTLTLNLSLKDPKYPKWTV